MGWRGRSRTGRPPDFLTSASRRRGTGPLVPARPTSAHFDGHGRGILRLAFVMGAVQIVNLVGYRIELFVLDRYDGLAAVGIYSVAMQAAEALMARSGCDRDRGHRPVVHDAPERAAKLIRNACVRGLLYTAGIAVAVGALAPS